MARVGWRSLAIPAAVIVAALGSLFLGDIEEPTLLVEALFDAGHAPLFGLIALALLHPLSRIWGVRLHTYAAAWALAVALGAATEIVQYFGPRDADLGDLARDAAGAAAFLLAALAIRRDDSSLFTRDSAAATPSYFRVLLLAVAAGLMAIAAQPVASTLLAYARRNAAFPVLCEFETAADLELIEVKDGTISLAPRPSVCGGGARAGLLTLSAGSLYPGLAVREPVPDWTGHETLAFELHSTCSDAVELVVRVHDTTHDNRYVDRFNRSLRIVPGCNRIRIPLADIRRAPRGREMDLEHVDGLVLFAVRPTDAITLYVDSIRLD